MNRDDEESQRFFAALRMTRTEGLSMAEELLDELIKVLRSHRSQKIGL
jgi:hypothetical protein